MKKGITKWLIGAFVLTMAVIQPASPVSETLNTVVTAQAAATAPGKIKLKSIRAITNNRIQINWEKTSGATHYRIFYKQYGAKRWTVLKTTNANTTSYTHISSAKYPIKCGQKYTYTVRAYNSKTRKWGSYNTKGLTTSTVPTTVTLTDIKTNSAKTAVQISWDKAYGGNYYRIYRRTPNTRWNLIANVKSNVFSYMDRNPINGKNNIYTVRMYNSAMKVAGGYSTTGLSAAIPASESLRLTGIKADAYNKITINWRKTANATNYRIYYKTLGSSWKAIATVGPNVTSYTHTSSVQCPINCGQKYTYTVRPYNSHTKKWGLYDTEGLTTNTVPSTVELKDTQVNPDGSITITWNEVPGGDWYCIYRKNESNPNWTPIGTYSITITSFTDRAPVLGEKNWYTVRKYDSKTHVYGKLNEPGLSVVVPDLELGEPFDERGEETIRLINEAREKNGIAPLQYSRKLTDLATFHARIHNRSDYEVPLSGITKLWCGSLYDTSPELIVNGFLEGMWQRRDILLDTKYTHIGVGICKDSMGDLEWILLFSSYNPDQATFTVTFDPKCSEYDKSSFTVPFNKCIYQEELPVLSREGYIFKGWKVIPSNKTFHIFYVYYDVVLEAVWEPNN